MNTATLTVEALERRIAFLQEEPPDEPKIEGLDIEDPDDELEILQHLKCMTERINEKAGGHGCITPGELLRFFEVATSDSDGQQALEAIVNFASRDEDIPDPPTACCYAALEYLGWETDGSREYFPIGLSDGKYMWAVRLDPGSSDAQGTGRSSRQLIVAWSVRKREYEVITELTPEEWCRLGGEL